MTNAVHHALCEGTRSFPEQALNRQFSAQYAYGVDGGGQFAERDQHLNSDDDDVCCPILECPPLWSQRDSDVDEHGDAVVSLNGGTVAIPCCRQHAGASRQEMVATDDIGTCSIAGEGVDDVSVIQDTPGVSVDTPPTSQTF